MANATAEMYSLRKNLMKSFLDMVTITKLTSLLYIGNSIIQIIASYGLTVETKILNSHDETENVSCNDLFAYTVVEREDLHLS